MQIETFSGSNEGRVFNHFFKSFVLFESIQGVVYGLSSFLIFRYQTERKREKHIKLKTFSEENNFLKKSFLSSPPSR